MPTLIIKFNSQVSVLGSLSFLIFINDIMDLFSGAVNIKRFADDIKIYLEITDISAQTSSLRRHNFELPDRVGHPTD